MLRCDDSSYNVERRGVRCRRAKWPPFVHRCDRLHDCATHKGLSFGCSDFRRRSWLRDERPMTGCPRWDGWPATVRVRHFHGIGEARPSSDGRPKAEIAWAEPDTRHCETSQQRRSR
jgi:hypothetical protein